MVKTLAITTNHGTTTVTWDGNPLTGMMDLDLVGSPVPQVTLTPAPAGPPRTAQWHIAQDMRANGYIVLYEIDGAAQEEPPIA